MDRRQEYMQRAYGDRYVEQPQGYGDPHRHHKQRLHRQQGGRDPYQQREMEQQDGMYDDYGEESRRRHHDHLQGYSMNPRERAIIRQLQMNRSKI